MSQNAAAHSFPFDSSQPLYTRHPAPHRWTIAPSDKRIA